LEQNISVETTDVHIAAANGHLDVVKHLSMKGNSNGLLLCFISIKFILSKIIVTLSSTFRWNNSDQGPEVNIKLIEHKLLIYSSKGYSREGASSVQLFLYKQSYLLKH